MSDHSAAQPTTVHITLDASVHASLDEHRGCVPTQSRVVEEMKKGRFKQVVTLELEILLVEGGYDDAEYNRNPNASQGPWVERIGPPQCSGVSDCSVCGEMGRVQHMFQSYWKGDIGILRVGPPQERKESFRLTVLICDNCLIHHHRTLHTCT